MRRFVLSIAVALAALALVPTASAEAPGASGNHAKLYYLALGDSVTAGTEPIGPGGAEVNRSGRGYADQLASMLREDMPKLELVNLACFYESTVTMLNGGGRCSYPHGSQLAEAEQFLHAHSKFTVLVTITMGANDIIWCPDTACVAAGFQAVAHNLPVIMSRLRAAGGDVRIVGVNYYNPYLAAWLNPALGPAFAQFTNDAIVFPLNGLLASAAAGAGASVANVQDAWRTGDFATTTSLPGVGAVPVNVATICAWTWMCSVGNIHPNPDGYRAIAETVRAASGL